MLLQENKRTESISVSLKIVIYFIPEPEITE